MTAFFSWVHAVQNHSNTRHPEIALNASYLGVRLPQHTALQRAFGLTTWMRAQESHRHDLEIINYTSIKITFLGMMDMG
jgi:hypothetical protein